MNTWPRDELNKINAEDELRISPLLKSGIQRKAVPIWVVRVGDDLYVRSVYGRASGWFRGVQAQHKGRIQAGGVTREVDYVEETDLNINELIDAAYRTKYGRCAASIIASITNETARSATIKLVPSD